MRHLNFNISLFMALAVFSVFIMIGYGTAIASSVKSPLEAAELEQEFPDDLPDNLPIDSNKDLIDKESKLKIGESFARPIFRDLAQSFLMLGGVDVRITPFADEYAKMAYCSLYREKYKDDFEWHSVRQQIQSRVASKKEYFRVLYELTGVVYLGRYNFNTQDFPLEKKTALYNVGSMTLNFEELSTKKGGAFVLCDDQEITAVFPKEYSVQMAQPLTFDRIKVPPPQAKSLIRRLQIMKNEDRKLYVRFRVKLITVPPDQKMRWDTDRGVPQRRPRGVIHGEMVSIDLFLDRDMSQPIINVPIDNLEKRSNDNINIEF